MQCKVLRALDEECDDVLKTLPADAIQSLYDALPISTETAQCIYRYFEAAARLYGIIPVKKLQKQGRTDRGGLFALKNKNLERGVNSGWGEKL